jgi:hypothetical protein
MDSIFINNFPTSLSGDKMLNTYAIQKLDELIEHFKTTVTQEVWDKDITEREERRKTHYKVLSSRESLSKISFEQFCVMIEELWALRGWHNKAWFIENQMGLSASNYKDALKALDTLLFGTNELEKKLEEFMQNSSGFGIAIVSEILTLSAANQYPLFNAKSQAVLKSLRIDLKEHSPRGKKKDIYLYLVFNKFYAEVLAQVKNKLPQITDYYRLDAFFWLLNFSDKVERLDDSANSEDDNVIVVKLGSAPNVESVKTLWKTNSVASFGFKELNNFDPANAFPDRYEALKKSMEANGAPEGLIKKVASYVHIFFESQPGKDWVIAYHKGKIYAYGRVSTPYSKLSNAVDWNQSIGVKWQWLDEAIDLSTDYPNLYQECSKNSSVSLVKKRSAKSEFFDFIKEHEEFESENDDLSESQITLDEISLETFLPKGYLEQLMSSFLDSKGKKQIIFDGPPGTGKTYVAQKIAKFLTKNNGQKGDWKLVPCHGSLSFEHVFQGLGPDKNGRISVRPGLLTEFARKAAENEHANFVLILDEINRANIHQVFGTLLFLLEYRGSEMDLPFGVETTMLPSNLFIIATMNSDDRSAGFVDYAFRRRFITWNFDPNPEVLRTYLKTAFPTGDAHNVDHEKVVGLFEKLNASLGKIDPNFQIGHSYFMTYYPPNESGLQRLWETEIIPLLEEKFFHNRNIIAEEFSLDRLLSSDAGSQKISAEDLVKKTGTR